MKSHNVSKVSVSIRPAAGEAGEGPRPADNRANPVTPALPYRSR